MPKRDKRATRSESSSSSSDEEDFHANQKGVYITVQNNYDTSSSSESDSEYEHKRHHHKKDKKKEPKDCKEKPRRRDSSSSSSSESSDEEEKSKCSFEEIYKYYKCRLLNDEELMAGGSTAYINTYNNVPMSLGKNYPVETSETSIVSNIDYKFVGSPYYVRESGTYIVFFVINCDQASQFCLFVNGKEEPFYRGGNNTGAGQLVLRNMLSLNKDDSVMIRNSISSTSVLTSATNNGGVQVGNGNTFLLLKVGAREAPKPSCEWKEEEHSKKKHYLFCKILEKMLCDKELMLQGFRTHGTFYNTVTQVVNTEANVVFSNQANVSGFTWNGADEIKIQEDGVYKVFFMATTNTSAQIAFSVNGVPLDFTIQGTNRGAGQISTRALLELKKDDVLTVKNHTSANGSLVLSEYAGGSKPALSALLTIFKIAPNKGCCPPMVKLNKYHAKCYEHFKSFLLTKKYLQIAGTQAYSSVTNAHHEPVAVGAAIDWAHIVMERNIVHVQGSDTFRIEEDGIYDIFGDVITNEPAQLTIFVNGTPDLSTIAGRDSGAARTLIRQFIELRRGDIVTVRNFESHIFTVNTSVNAGGELVGQNCQFMLFKLSPLPNAKPPTEPCPPQPPCPPPQPPCPPPAPQPPCPPKKHHHHNHRKHQK
jgi:hypothetical protein